MTGIPSGPDYVGNLPIDPNAAKTINQIVNLLPPNPFYQYALAPALVGGTVARVTSTVVDALATIDCAVEGVGACALVYTAAGATIAAVNFAGAYALYQIFSIP